MIKPARQAAAGSGHCMWQVLMPRGTPEKTTTGSTTTDNRRRNAVVWSNFFLFAGFLALWPLGAWMRQRAFEARRWAESDYAPGSGGSGDDEDDD